MDNMYIYNYGRGVPENAKRMINGGRLKGKTDINPVWRIKTLTELFGPCGIGWYFNTVRQWMETSGEETAAFVNIELYVKIDGEWSKPVFGTGGSMFSKREKDGLNVSDECFKMATTDAISVACKSLGIGADVYWNDDATKYPTQTQAVPAPQAGAGGAAGNAQGQQAVPGGQDPAGRLAPVMAELARIGYSAVSVCRTYNLRSIYDMSDLQIKNFLKKAAAMPDKAGA